MDIITKLDAKVKGLTRYFTGKSCGRGHITERLIIDGSCVECKRIIEQNRYRSGKGKIEHQLEYQRKRENILAKMKAEYNYTNERREYLETWRDINSEKITQYRKQNAGLYAYHASLRRKKVKLATPVWFKEEKYKIKQLYIEAARLKLETGIEHHVDHIIPLIHDNVCGLHTLCNLQIITMTENLQKKNKFN